MKVTYEYDTNNPEDNARHEVALIAQEVHDILWQLDSEMERCSQDPSASKTSEEWKDYLRTLAKERGVHIRGDYSD